jgi:hypothetical protein
MHRAEFDLAAIQHLRDAGALRAGIGIIEPPGDAGLEHVQVLRQHDAGLDHMEIVDLAGIAGAEAAGEAIGLFLVVAFETDAIPGPQDRFEQVDHGAGRHDFAFGMGAPRLDANIAGLPLATPLGHSRAPRGYAGL